MEIQKRAWKEIDKAISEINDEVYDLVVEENNLTEAIKISDEMTNFLTKAEEFFLIDRKTAVEFREKLMYALFFADNYAAHKKRVANGEKW